MKKKLLFVLPLLFVSCASNNSSILSSSEEVSSLDSSSTSLISSNAESSSSLEASSSFSSEIVSEESISSAESISSEENISSEEISSSSFSSSEESSSIVQSIEIVENTNIQIHLLTTSTNIGDKIEFTYDNLNENYYLERFEVKNNENLLEVNYDIVNNKYSFIMVEGLVSINPILKEVQRISPYVDYYTNGYALNDYDEDLNLRLNIDYQGNISFYNQAWLNPHFNGTYEIVNDELSGVLNNGSNQYTFKANLIKADCILTFEISLDNEYFYFLFGKDDSLSKLVEYTTSGKDKTYIKGFSFTNEKFFSYAQGNSDKKAYVGQVKEDETGNIVNEIEASKAYTIYYNNLELSGFKIIANTIYLPGNERGTYTSSTNPSIYLNGFDYVKIGSKSGRYTYVQGSNEISVTIDNETKVYTIDIDNKTYVDPTLVEDTTSPFAGKVFEGSFYIYDDDYASSYEYTLTLTFAQEEGKVTSFILDSDEWSPPVIASNYCYYDLDYTYDEATREVVVTKQLSYSVLKVKMTSNASHTQLQLTTDYHYVSARGTKLNLK